MGLDSVSLEPGGLEFMGPGGGGWARLMGLEFMGPIIKPSSNIIKRETSGVERSGVGSSGVDSSGGSPAHSLKKSCKPLWPYGFFFLPLKRSRLFPDFSMLRPFHVPSFSILLYVLEWGGAGGIPPWGGGWAPLMAHGSGGGAGGGTPPRGGGWAPHMAPGFRTLRTPDTAERTGFRR